MSQKSLVQQKGKELRRRALKIHLLISNSPSLKIKYYLYLKNEKNRQVGRQQYHAFSVFEFVSGKPFFVIAFEHI